MRALNKCPLESMNINFLKNEVLKDLQKDISRHDIENLRTDLEYIESFTKSLNAYIKSEIVVKSDDEYLFFDNSFINKLG